MNRAQLGYIEISDNVLEEFWINNKEFIPLDVEIKMSNNYAKYLCFCKHFRVLGEGDLVPVYTVEYKRQEKTGLVMFLNINEVPQ